MIRISISSDPSADWGGAGVREVLFEWVFEVGEHSKPKQSINPLVWTSIRNILTCLYSNSG